MNRINKDYKFRVKGEKVKRIPQKQLDSLPAGRDLQDNYGSRVKKLTTKTPRVQRTPRKLGLETKSQRITNKTFRQDQQGL
jgi:hypothetical protein